MHSIRRPYALLLSIFMLTFLSYQTAYAANSEAPDVYVASSDPMGDVQEAMEKAKADNKHLLVVMGASWCHDSRGLASTFTLPGVKQVLDTHYQVVYVDVGYFNDLRPISERFGQAHYFATPTVMIINAQSEALLNASTMAQWGRADSIPPDQYVEYFEHYATLKNAPANTLSSQHQIVISEFKSAQGQRLMDAYGKLGPIMEQEDREGEPSDEFMAVWKEVKSYRLALQEDIQHLYEQAQEQPSQKLALPTYSSFSWE